MVVLSAKAGLHKSRVKKIVHFYRILWNVATGFLPAAGPAPGQSGAQKCRGLDVLVGTAG